MSFNHAVVWLDQAEAHVLKFNDDAAATEHISAQSKHQRQHAKPGIPDAGYAPEDQKYYHAVGQVLANVRKVLIVGPSGAKFTLMKYLQKHDPVTAERVVGIEALYQLADGQFLAYAQFYFVKFDQLRGNARRSIA